MGCHDMLKSSQSELTNETPGISGVATFTVTVTLGRVIYYFRTSLVVRKSGARYCFSEGGGGGGLTFRTYS